VSIDSLERVKETAVFKELAKKATAQRRKLFASLLVTPIQRIPRYLLLLQVSPDSLAYELSDFVLTQLLTEFAEAHRPFSSRLRQAVSSPPKDGRGGFVYQQREEQIRQLDYHLEP